MKINFVGKTAKQLYFKDLAVGDCFYNTSGRGRGALYQKIAGSYTTSFGSPIMLELATGMCWEPTLSSVEKVEVEINVATITSNSPITQAQSKLIKYPNYTRKSRYSL